MKRLFIIVTVASLALLGACSDSDGTPAPAPPPQQQDFTEQVRRLAETSPDTTEPADISSLDATSSETSEPSTVELP